MVDVLKELGTFRNGLDRVVSGTHTKNMICAYYRVGSVRGTDFGFFTTSKTYNSCALLDFEAAKRGCDTTNSCTYSPVSEIHCPGFKEMIKKDAER